MRFLLDSCTFVWFDSNSAKLSRIVTDRLTDPLAELYLSPVSVWELVVKQQTGRPDAPRGDIPAMADYHLGRGHVRLLSLDLGHVRRQSMLPDHHRDPWDRILICQALAEDLTILTPDHLIHQYPAPWEW